MEVRIKNRINNSCNHLVTSNVLENIEEVLATIDLQNGIF